MAEADGEAMSGGIELRRRATTEAIGTAFLLMAVVGSGIMADRLFEGDAGLALFVNSVATGAVLAALIIAFGPISGAHINPAVTLSFALRRNLPRGDAVLYVVAQLAGAVAGVALAHLMFREPVFALAATYRDGPHQWLGEGVATFGLVGVILASKRHGPLVVAPVVGCFIMSAYWFTSSTSFANPAVTVARAVTDSFSGIHPGSVAGFVLAQSVGAVAATVLVPWLSGSSHGAAESQAEKSQAPSRREIA